MAGGFQPGQAARYFLRAVPLASPWAHTVACEKFGADLIALFPPIARGRDAGKPQGYLLYIQASRGGWAWNVPGYPQGRVVYPGTSDWRVAMHIPETDPHGHSVVARWYPPVGEQPARTERVQLPEEAQARFRAYGRQPRYE